MLTTKKIFCLGVSPIEYYFIKETFNEKKNI